MKSTNHSSLADQIRAARLSRGLTQKALASKAEISLRTLRHLEDNEAGSVRILRRLIRVLEVDLVLPTCGAAMKRKLQSNR